MPERFSHGGAAGRSGGWPGIFVCFSRNTALAARCCAGRQEARAYLSNASEAAPDIVPTTPPERHHSPAAEPNRVYIGVSHGARRPVTLTLPIRGIIRGVPHCAAI
jgi:hypothetical protein